MAQLKISVQERSQVGGNRPRRLRSQGFIPAVLYGGGEETMPLALELSRLKKETGMLHENQIVALEIAGDGGSRTRSAIVKDTQFDHLSGAFLHIDFQQISLDEKLTATVAIESIGDPIGVTRDGGILEHILREIEVHCLPADLPDSIEVDVSALEIGDTIHVRDIGITAGIEILTEPEISIFTIAAPITEEEAEALETAAEAPTEAEVIGEEGEAEAETEAEAGEVEKAE